jgi:hypothetical protein
MSVRALCLISAGWLIALLPAVGIAQEAAPSASSVNEKQQIEAALKLTKEAAGQYEFLLGESGERAELLAEPLLKWSNPAQGEIHGNVFLWTSGGRPAVVASIFKWFSPHTHMSHEFHSLWEQPLRGKANGKELWPVSEGGLKFAPLPDAPAPAAGKGQRLLQMRELARACAATKRERDGNLSELRLLTQPIYRYAAPQADITDGALFVFVQGTDPEVFLLLEAREAGGKPQWQFAATRMNGVGFELKYRDQPIWKAEIMPWADISGHRLPYTSFYHAMP